MQVLEDTKETEITTAEASRRFGNAEDHDACGNGIVVSSKGKPQNEVVDRGFRMLEALEQRGAESADGVSGDGAGVKYDFDQAWARGELSTRVPHLRSDTRIGIGQIFLPPAGDDPTAQLLAIQIVQDVLTEKGITNFVWRNVETDSSPEIVGPIAKQTQPDIKQILFECPGGRETKRNPKIHYEALQEIEKRIRDQQNPALNDSFYICSLSDQEIVYKAMVKPSKLEAFYKDLQELRKKGKATYLQVHQRFATNALPKWSLAHPYRFLTHNGEINAIVRLASEFKARMQKYIGQGHEGVKTSGSDTAQLDTILTMMVANGWGLLQAVSHLIPPALHPSQSKTYQTWVKVTQALTTQADGPASLIATAGRWVVAIADRHGLRPLNIVRPKGSNIYLISSEVGPGLKPGEVAHATRSMLSGGQSCAFDLDKGQYLDTRAYSEKTRQPESLRGVGQRH